MAERTPPRASQIDWDQAARDYARRLTPGHLMESVAQSTQRKIFDAALDLVHAERPDVQPFGELLVQWVRRGFSRPGQVVPDNMVVVHPEPIQAESSFSLSKQPTKPFWVLEYVSRSNPTKDYEESFQKYEKQLRILYYLIFDPEAQEVTLYRHSGKKYAAVVPNEEGRAALPEIEMEVGLLGEWLRFWFRGRLLPLPVEMQRELKETKQTLDQTKQTLDQRTQERDAALEELERLRQEVARLKGAQP
jgi:Uma2 family endonuclease